MPHFIIECSENLIKKVSKQVVMQRVFETALASALFTKGDIKVRIKTYGDYIVGGEKDDFIHVFGNIMEGRTAEQKNKLSSSIVKVLNELFPDAPVVSMNIRDFEKIGYCNKSMI